MQDYLAPQVILLEKLARRAKDFDIIHLHTEYLGYQILTRLDVPFFATLHSRLDLTEMKRIYETFPGVPVVSISNSQREPIPIANYVSTIYHGLPRNLLTPGPSKGGYLAFIGRISPEKAPDAAIRIAGAAGMKIRIAAKIDNFDRAYFHENIEPLFALPHVEYIGEINEVQKAEFLGNAARLLFPIAWREPFGLAIIEAMACGTPVIAMRCGSVPEVLEEGISGFIVENEEQAVAAVHRLPKLSRAKVRKAFDDRFTARRMAEDYVQLYQHLVKTKD
jgi:glycosyltransferase involved in cell wall biosynthesis